MTKLKILLGTVSIAYMLIGCSSTQASPATDNKEVIDSSVHQNEVSLKQVAKAVEKVISDAKEHRVKTDSTMYATNKELKALQEKIVQLNKQIVNLSGSQPLTYSIENTSTEATYTHETIGKLFVRKSSFLDSTVAYVFRSGEKVTVTAVENGMGFVGNGWCSMKYLKPLTKDKN